MADDPKTGPMDESASRRYRINLALFVVLMLAVLLWFHRHIYQYATQTTFVGGTLTLWGGWKLIQSWVKWGMDTAGIPLARRILSQPAATEYLVFGLIVSGALYLGTSSIYLVYEGADKGENKFTIEILNEDHPYIAPIEITSYARVDGRPLFLRATSLNLVFRIKAPRGYKALAKNFRPWSSLRIKVPADFERQNFRLIRLIPGFTLKNELPDIDDAAKSAYYLQIDYRNAIYRIDDLRRETIFAGASLEDDMQLAIDGLRQDEITAELDRYLREQQVPSEKRDDIAENWQARYRFLPTAEFEPGATIKITVGNNGDPDSPPLFTDSITLSADRLMTTLFLELPP